MISGSLADALPHGGAPAADMHDRHELPPPTPMFGREHELDAIQRLLAQPGSRLLTLNGPDGVGKTRLALAAADAIGDRFADGVVFVPLAFATTEALTVSAIAEALGVSEQQETSLLEGIVLSARDRAMLLILDGTEHREAVAPVVERLLADCPLLRLLVTAGSPLSVGGELVVDVKPLALPSARNWLSLSEEERGAAVGLFVERARTVQPELALTMANAVAIAEICRRLDGLPLAIEIAAARSRLLPPQPMLARLDTRLPQPYAGQQDEIVRAVISWSHDLLKSTGQALFRAIAVANGAFTSETAAILAGEATINDELETLVSASLLRVVGGEGDQRQYRMLDPVRAIGLEQLAASGEASVVRQRHAVWLLALAQAAEHGLTGSEQPDWLARLEQEIDNIRAALKWFYSTGQVEEGVTLASTLSRFWATRAHVSEGWAWIERGLADPAALTPATRIRALTEGGWLALLQGRLDEATRLADECLAFSRQISDPDGIATGLDTLGELALTGGDYPAAIEHFNGSITIWTTESRPWNVAMSLISRACAALSLDDTGSSRASLAEARQIMLTSADPRGVALTDLSLAWLELRLGDTSGAASHFRDALACFHRLGVMLESADGLEGLAAVSDATGDRERAARLLGTAQAIRESIGARPDFLSRIGHQPDRRSLRARLTDPSLSAALEAGRTTSPDAVIMEAIADP